MSTRTRAVAAAVDELLLAGSGSGHGSVGATAAAPSSDPTLGTVTVA